MEDKKRKKYLFRLFRKGSIRMTSMLFLVSLFSLSVCAAEGDQWKDFYERNSAILKTNDLVSSGVRTLGWWIVEMLVGLTDTVQKLYDKSFGFIDMTTNSTINEFVQRFKPAFIALTAFALLYLGYILIMQHDKKPNVATNICIAVLCVSCSTFMFGTLNGLAHSFKTGVDSYSYKGSDKAAITIVDENMIDVLKLYKKHGAALKPADYKKTTGGITEKNFGYFRINTVINYAGDNFDSEENPFKYRLDAGSPSGEARITENDNGWGINDGSDSDFGNEFYYRYNFEWLNAYIQLIGVIIVYLAMAYKCVRVTFELVVARLLAYLYSAELSGGEKIRKVLCFIRDSYILLGVTAICIKLYAVFTAFIHSYVGANLTAAIFSLFLAFTVIDGPNLVEKLLGMDAGLKSSTARMMALGGMALGASRATTRSASNIFDRLRQKTRHSELVSAAKKGASDTGAGDQKAKDAMDNAGKNGKGDKIDAATKENGSGNNGTERGNKNSRSEGSASGNSPDFMDRDVSSRAGQNDPTEKMDKGIGDRNQTRAENPIDRMNRKSEGENRSSMPKRSTGTKSKYTSGGEKGKK